GREHERPNVGLGAVRVQLLVGPDQWRHTRHVRYEVKPVRVLEVFELTVARPDVSAAIVLGAEPEIPRPEGDVVFELVLDVAVACEKRTRLSKDDVRPIPAGRARPRGAKRADVARDGVVERARRIRYRRRDADRDFLADADDTGA